MSQHAIMSLGWILEREAGPELDSLVAEHVMGWTRVPWAVSEWRWAKVPDPRFFDQVEPRHWAPSADHWIALDVLMQRFKVWSLGRYVDRTAAEVRYTVRIHDAPGAMAVAAELPLAVCRAALIVAAARL